MTWLSPLARVIMALERFSSGETNSPSRFSIWGLPSDHKNTWLYPGRVDLTVMEEGPSWATASPSLYTVPYTARVNRGLTRSSPSPSSSRTSHSSTPAWAVVRGVKR